MSAIARIFQGNPVASRDPRSAPEATGIWADMLVGNRNWRLGSVLVLVCGCSDPAGTDGAMVSTTGPGTSTVSSSGSQTSPPPATVPPTADPSPVTSPTAPPVASPPVNPPPVNTPSATVPMNPEPEPMQMGGGGSTSGGGVTSMGGGGTGGMNPQGGASGSDGMGGSSAGGMAGSGGTGMAPVTMSEGCGQAGPDVGSSQSPLNVSNHQYYVKLPASYDENNAYPVMFMFHPTNNPLNWAEQNAGFESTEAKDTWIRVYPGAGNNASGWGSGDVDFFEPLYDAITNAFCVDTARVFASGESSGGDFSSILGCEYAHLLRATAPCATKNVQGYPLDASQRECTGQVAAVVIHGVMDNVVGPENGPLTRDFYKELNNCSDDSVPVEGYSDSMSNCVEFQGCDQPTFWCQHSDPEYSNTNHGWPRFAGAFLTEEFSKY